VRTVFIAPTVTDAAIVKNLLAQHGIHCRIVERIVSRYAAGNTEVWILDDRREAEAKRLIREVFNNTAPDKEWRCGQCSESNPGTFFSCWSCSTDKR